VTGFAAPILFPQKDGGSPRCGLDYQMAERVQRGRDSSPHALVSDCRCAKHDLCRSLIIYGQNLLSKNNYPNRKIVRLRNYNSARICRNFFQKFKAGKIKTDLLLSMREKNVRGGGKHSQMELEARIGIEPTAFCAAPPQFASSRTELNRISGSIFAADL
jgi:hypothetical protein